MLKKALSIYIVTALVAMGTFAYAENGDDNSSEQTDRPVIFDDPQQEESLVYSDEDQPDFFAACSCKGKDKKQEQPQVSLACSCEEEGDVEPPKPVEEEPKPQIS